MDMGKAKKHICLKSLEIHIYGIVQGVGFRPFIMKLAKIHKIYGEVCNLGGHVVIKATGLTKNVEAFVKKIVEEKPLQAEIIKMDIMERPYLFEETFRIASSKDHKNDVVILSPDLPVCKKCLEEMQDEKNLRCKHPFISCTECGPRYSIIEKIPYDRETTSMSSYSMCQNCYKEYISKQDRRSHAQTISCHKCGPYLIYKRMYHKESIHHQALTHAAEDILKGKIICIKGIGGYHLCCSPFDEDVVRRLRNIKNREKKPLAVMFLNSAEIEKYCFMTKEEQTLIESKQTPIVLLKRKTSSICKGVYMDSNKLGVFISYTPLHYMLIKQCGPLVMTSANLSDLPVIKDDDQLFSDFGKRADGVLYHNRKIVTALDDSVVQISSGKVQIIRRARGYVPLPVYLGKQTGFNTKSVFAVGGHQKASFCLRKNNLAYLSQYLGDMDNEESIKRYKETYEHMKNLLNICPDVVVCDKHPRYFTTEFAKTSGLPIIRVQHHHAHIASVMAEHHLNKVIGVAFDGTGFGDDCTVWGGEFLICENKIYRRQAHLKYVTLLGQDESVKDVKKTAVCYFIAANIRNIFFDKRWDVIEKAIQNKINTYTSSSMGRLFDALSSLLGICDYSHYEGQAAIMLEQYAAEAQEKNIMPDELKFHLSMDMQGHILIDQITFFKDVARKMEKDDKKNICALALGIHRAVSKMIVDVVKEIDKQYNIKKVALSGGVFQNIILLEHTEKLLEEEGYSVYINHQVPVNDGGIALGQVYIGMQY